MVRGMLAVETASMVQLSELSLRVMAAADLTPVPGKVTRSIQAASAPTEADSSLE